MFCKNCGNTLKETSLFCSKCGNAVEKKPILPNVEVSNAKSEIKTEVKPIQTPIASEQIKAETIVKSIPTVAPPIINNTKEKNNKKNFIIGGAIILLLAIGAILYFIIGKKDAVPQQQNNVTVAPSSNVTVNKPKQLDLNNIDSLHYYLMTHEFACYDYDGNNVAIDLIFNDKTVNVNITYPNAPIATNNSQIDPNTQPALIECDYYLGGKISIQGSEGPNLKNAISLHNWELSHCDAEGWSHDLCRIDKTGTINLFVKTKWCSFYPVNTRPVTIAKKQVKSETLILLGGQISMGQGGNFLFFKTQNNDTLYSRSWSDTYTIEGQGDTKEPILGPPDDMRTVYPKLLNKSFSVTYYLDSIVSPTSNPDNSSETMVLGAHITQMVLLQTNNEVNNQGTEASLLGEWDGAFGNNHISLFIDNINNGSVTGYNIVKGNKRALTGTISNGNHFELSEPGDDKWDGKFQFIISNGTLSGSWTANNGKLTHDFTLTKKETPSEGTALATSERAYFYKEADISTQRKAYMVKGEQGKYNQVSGNFIYVLFTNPQGIETKGWMLKTDFKLGQ